MTATETPVTAVSVETDVDAPVEHAFHVFTDRIGDWWDPGHHLLDGELVSMTFEPRVGGHVVDRYADGRECRWARVLAYDPPRRLVISWDVTPRWQVETDPAKTSEVEVTFTATGPERTHVVLTHHHLDRHGEGWQSMRDAVAGGWSLARFAEVAGQSSP
jgi:uncharacterized protein YndB with AHSA1/START domain